MLSDDDKKALGGIAGWTGGMAVGGKAGMAAAAAFPPLAPLFILGGLIVGGTAGAISGYKNPAGGAMAAMGAVAGVPLPSGGGPNAT